MTILNPFRSYRRHSSEPPAKVAPGSHYVVRNGRTIGPVKKNGNGELMVDGDPLRHPTLIFDENGGARDAQGRSMVEFDIMRRAGIGVDDRHLAWMEGVLPDRHLRALILNGTITADAPILDEQIQPASLDLRLGSCAYRLRASFLAGEGRSIEARLEDFAMHRMELADGAVLEKGCVYLIPLLERVCLPQGLEAVANAKSSTGRLDLLTRLVGDGGMEFDRLPEGYCGPLYAEVCPRSFSVCVRPGMRLNQLRLRRGGSRLSDKDLLALHRNSRLVEGEAMISDGLGFSVDLSGPGIIGWRARPHSAVIDLDLIDHYDARAFWDPLNAENGQLILDPGAFYILKSQEAVAIPPTHAAEMSPYLALAGEFRVHYAGFFDPGFGVGERGAGARGVLEVRCHEAPFVLEHGQCVGRLIFERMAQEPDRLYGTGLSSNYQGQSLKLAKQFRDF